MPVRLTLDPASPFVHYELAWTYRAMERTSDAVAALRIVVALPATNAREVQQREDAKREIDRLLTQDQGQQPQPVPAEGTASLESFCPLRRSTERTELLKLPF